jgi:hypothetical protein
MDLSQHDVRNREARQGSVGPPKLNGGYMAIGFDYKTLLPGASGGTTKRQGLISSGRHTRDLVAYCSRRSCRDLRSHSYSEKNAGARAARTIIS